MDRPIRKETNESAVIDAPNLLRQIDRRILLAGVGMVSFASLLLELALTRLFSVVLFGCIGPSASKSWSRRATACQACRYYWLLLAEGQLSQRLFGAAC